jgi:hypothetical protein
MPQASYTIKTPDGASYTITSPGELTGEQLGAYASSLRSQTPANSSTPGNIASDESQAGFDIGGGHPQYDANNVPTGRFNQPAPLGAGIWHPGYSLAPDLAMDPGEADPDVMRLQARQAGAWSPSLDYAGGDPRTIGEAGSQMATSAGMLSQILPNAGAAATEGIGQAIGQPKGWWMDDPSNAGPRESQARALGILQYLLPGAGEIGGAQLGFMAAGDPAGTASGLYDTAKQIGHGLVSSDTPLTERLADALAVGGALYGGGALLHRGGAMLDVAADNAMISQLTREGFEQPVAEEAVRRAATLNDLVRDNPGRFSPEAVTLGRSPMRLARSLADAIAAESRGHSGPDLPEPGEPGARGDRFRTLEIPGQKPPAEPAGFEPPAAPEPVSTPAPSHNTPSPDFAPTAGKEPQSGGLELRQDTAEGEPTFTPEQFAELQQRLTDKTLPREVFEDAGNKLGLSAEETAAAAAHYTGTSGPITSSVIGHLMAMYLSTASPSDVQQAATQLGLSPEELQAAITHHISQGGIDDSIGQQNAHSVAAQLGENAEPGSNGGGDRLGSAGEVTQSANDQAASNSKAGEAASDHLASARTHESKTYDEWQKIADDLWDQIEQENPGTISDSDYRTWPANVVGHGPTERWVSNKPGDHLYDAYAQAMNARDNVERAAKSASLGALKLSPSTLNGPIGEAGIREAAKKAYELAHSPMRFIGGDGSPVTRKAIWDTVLSELISSGIHRDRTIDSRQFDTHEDLYHHADRGKELVHQAISLMKDMGIDYDPHEDGALPQSNSSVESAVASTEPTVDSTDELHPLEKGFLHSYRIERTNRSSDTYDGLPYIKRVEQPDLASLIGNEASVFHETNLEGAKGILAKISAGPRNHSGIYVSDNRDLAIGQKGSGLTLEIDPRRVNGAVNMGKPGLDFVQKNGGGQEYIIDRSVRGAVRAIEGGKRQIDALAKMPGIARKFDFSNPETLSDGRLRIVRQSRAQVQSQPEALPAPDNEKPDSSLDADSGAQGGLQFQKVQGGGGGSRRSRPQRAAASGAAGAIKQLLSQRPLTPREATKLALRKRGADLARRQYTAAMQLEAAAKVFSQRSNQENLDFIHRMETGQPQPTAEDQDLAIRLRTLMDQRRDEIIALGTGKLQNWIENYFPHIWKDPNKAVAVFSQIFGKRPTEGSKSFLKKRSIPTIQEGMAAPYNLEPISYNPVDLTLAKIHEMDKYLTWQRVVLDLKERGLLHFVSVFKSPAELNATGLAKIEDPSFTVYGPHRVEVSEAFDKYIVEQLGTLAQMLGVNAQRVMNIAGKGTLGAYDPATKNVLTKFATPETTLTHELGHALDHKFRLGAWLRRHGGAEFTKETSDLALYRVGSPGPTGAVLSGPVSAAHRSYIMRRDERVANLIHAVVHAPELAKTVAPQSVQLLHQFAATNKEMRFLLNIKPGLEKDIRTDFVKVPGLQTMGHYAAEKGVAKILNNALSPGLKDARDPRIRIPFRGYMAVNNVMNRTNLGLSAFHAVTSTLNASISDVALGLRQLTRVGGNGAYWRRAASGVGMVARGAVPGASMVADLLLGSKVRGAYVGLGSDPAMFAAVEGVIAGGGHFGLNPFYETGAWGQLGKALAASYGAMKRREFLPAAGQGSKSVYLFLPAIFDLAAKPIMQEMVPKLKVAAFTRMLESDMEQSGVQVGTDEWKRLAARAWQSVDNRYGQLVYDNIFVHNAVKDLGMASVRSLGWNLGTFAELGGGAADAAGDPFTGRLKEEGISHRLAYTLAMPIVVGLIGGILHYFMTGKRPERPRDYFFPATGRKLADGSEERIAIPSYMKDVYAYRNNPVATAMHKLAPLPQMLFQMWNNKAYFGQEIRHEGDGNVQQLKDTVAFMAKSFTPFTVSSEEQFVDQTGHPNIAAALGFTPAAPFVSHSPAQLKASEFMAGHTESGPRTADQVKHMQDVSKVLALYQNGEKQKAQQMLDQMPLTDKQLEAIEGRLDDIDSGVSPIVHQIPQLTPEQALKVYDLGTKFEKGQLGPSVADRLERDVESGRLGAWTPAQLKKIYAQRPDLAREGSSTYR